MSLRRFQIFDISLSEGRYHNFVNFVILSEAEIAKYGLKTALGYAKIMYKEIVKRLASNIPIPNGTRAGIDQTFEQVSHD